jgi:uncharacterized protein YbaP (TraB family)
MKKISILAGLLFAATTWCYSQNSVIWEISGNGLEKKSYLMGTLKFTGVKEFYLPANTTKLIHESEIFAIEDEIDHHAQHELNSATHFPKGQSLATVLSPEDYQKVKSLFQKQFKVKSATFDKKYAHIKPLPLSIVMTRLSLGEKVKFYDIELLTLAKDNNKPSFSLESVEREAEALNSFSIEEQVKALMHSIDHFDEQKAEFKKLMADYPTGNLEEIFAYTLHPLEDSPEFIESFYYKRNEEWLPKIEKMIKENKAFIALGVSHLEGERGILKLLEGKGYTLTPVPAH